MTYLQECKRANLHLRNNRADALAIAQGKSCSSQPAAFGDGLGDFQNQAPPGRRDGLDRLQQPAGFLVESRGGIAEPVAAVSFLQLREELGKAYFQGFTQFDQTIDGK